VKDWLNHPTTKLFKEALKKESEKSREDMANIIDNTDMDRDELYREVNLNKAVRFTYEQFCNENANQTIINMFDEHKLLTKEEEDNDTD
jgi:hypothetical protein